MMFYREAGQFNTRYAQDRRVFALRQDRHGLVALLLFAFVVVPWLGNDYWFSAILIPFLVLSLAGLGLNLLTGYAGQLSLGSAAFMAVGAFATYNLEVRVAGLPLLVSIALGGLAAALVAVLFGLPSLRIKGFYLLVSTLAAQFFVTWALTRFSWFSNNSASGVISAPRLEVLGVNLDAPAGRYLLTLNVVVALFWLGKNLVRSELGRNWMAVRDMDTAAAVIGIALAKTKLLAFAISGFFPRGGRRALGLRLPGHGGATRFRPQSVVPDPVHHHYRRPRQPAGQLPRRGLHRAVSGVALEPGVAAARRAG